MSVKTPLLIAMAIFGICPPVHLQAAAFPEALPASSMNTGVEVAQTPVPGSGERTAILDAVRRHLKVDTTFLVQHLLVRRDWAYFEGVEFLKGNFESDYFVSALLTRRTPGRWEVAEAWVLGRDRDDAHERFVERVAERVKKGDVPADILTAQLRHAVGW